LAKKRKRRVKRVLSIGNLADEVNDKGFWLSETPDERMQALELLRQKV